MSTATRFTVAAATIGGTAWIIKTVTITVRDAYFDPLEAWFFIAGLLGIVATVAMLAWSAAGRFHPVLRALFSVAAVFGMVVATVLIDALVSAVYGGDNLGIDNEVGLFVAAVAALLYAFSTVRGAREAAGRPVSA